MTERNVFILVLAVNALVASLYFFWGCFFQIRRQQKDVRTNSEEEEDDARKVRKNTIMSKTGYALITLIMLLCPVVGPLFFLFSWFVYLFLFRGQADLDDVIFGKDKVKAERKAEEDRERNRVPLEEALAVSDQNSLRTLMMDVIQGNVDNTLASISLALNSEDTETAHYAAAVLRDALNDFRQRSQEIYNKMQKGGPHAADYACLLIEYMNGILSQEVFSDMEQQTFVNMMEDACDYLYLSKNDRYRLVCEYMEWLAVRMLKLKAYDRVKLWAERMEEMYPDELAAYTVQLKLYFGTQDKQNFFDVMNRLKQSSVVLDRNTLDLIRVFS